MRLPLYFWTPGKNPKRCPQNEKLMSELRSDTFSLPTPEMLSARLNARLGNDGYGEDPTVNELRAFWRLQSSIRKQPDFQNLICSAMKKEDICKGQGTDVAA